MELAVTELAHGRNPHAAIQMLHDILDNERASGSNSETKKLAAVMLSTDGATENLVHVTTGDDEAKHTALVVLNNLCLASAEFRADVSSGYLNAVIPALIKAMQPSVSQHDAQISIKIESLKTLVVLGKNALTAQRAAAAGAIELLVRLIQLPESSMHSKDIKWGAATALMVLCTASRNRGHHALSAGAMAAVSRLAFSQHAILQTSAATALNIIFTSLTPALMSTHRQHIKVAIAALSSLLARSAVPGTVEAATQEAVFSALATLLIRQGATSHLYNTAEHVWVKDELSRALTHAKADDILLEVDSKAANRLLVAMLLLMPERVLELVPPERPIGRLKQLLQLPDAHMRCTAAEALLKMKAARPEAALLIGSEIDTIWQEFKTRDRSTKAAVTLSNCGKCGAADGVKLSECSACGEVAYCSKECQKKHWKVHKPSCSCMNQWRSC